jgi:hypothetical protein
MRSRLILSLAVAALGVLPAQAAANFFPADAVDGPADIERLGDLAVARDGQGAVAYLKREGGESHVFVSRLVGGTWQAPERVDGGLGGSSSNAAVAMSDNGRLAVAFVNGGALYGVVRPAGEGFGPPTVIHSGSAVTEVDLSMSPNNAAYVAFTVAGQQGDVRAARLHGTTWTPLGAPLDIDPAANAGTGAGRPRVAVSADNNAVVTWAEGPAGATQVYARRLTRTALSTYPQQVSLPSFEGRAGGRAEVPVIDIQDDNSYARVVFRQAFDDGGTWRDRVISRRLVGSLFEAAAAVDGLGFPAGEGGGYPGVSMTSRGVGLVTSALEGSNASMATPVDGNDVKPTQRIGEAAVPARTVPAIGQNEDGLVAWQRDGGTVFARYLLKHRWQGEAALSRPEWGPVAGDLGLMAGADRNGNASVAFVQGDPGSRRVVVGTYDRPPLAFAGTTTPNYNRRNPPLLKWADSQDLQGGATYRVIFDGRPVGETRDRQWQFTTRVAEGPHKWRVVAVDRRGQTTSTPLRYIRVDSTRPRGTLRITGQRRRGQALRFQVTGADRRGPGSRARPSGLRDITLDFGDRSRKVKRSKAFSASRVYRRGGTFRVRATVTDKAGNQTVLTRRVRIAG